MPTDDSAVRAYSANPVYAWEHGTPETLAVALTSALDGAPGPHVDAAVTVVVTTTDDATSEKTFSTSDPTFGWDAVTAFIASCAAAGRVTLRASEPSRAGSADTPHAG